MGCIDERIQRDMNAVYITLAADRAHSLAHWVRRTWDFEAYKRQQHSVTSLKEQMERIGAWVIELEKMRSAYNLPVCQHTIQYILMRQSSKPQACQFHP